MKQYAVDFGRTADRIQMEATKSVTLSAQGGGAWCQDRAVLFAKKG